MKRKRAAFDVLHKGRVFQVRRYPPGALSSIGVNTARFLAAAACRGAASKAKVKQSLLQSLKHTPWVPDGEPIFLSQELLLPVRCTPVRFEALGG